MNEYECPHCGHRWLPRKATPPKKCSKCQKPFTVPPLPVKTKPSQLLAGATAEELKTLASVLHILRAGGTDAKRIRWLLETRRP